MGAKKFDTCLETREIKLFGRDIPGFCRDIPGAPEKFEKKKFVFNFRSLKQPIEKRGIERFLSLHFTTTSDFVNIIWGFKGRGSSISSK